MTDKEIIKALECCASGKNCEECSLNCKAPTSKDILDLINRQQAEIENLQKELASKGLKYSILEREKAEDILGFVDDLKLARAEAIKEFAGRLTKEMYTVGFDIDNLVKEMVGEQK